MAWVFLGFCSDGFVFVCVFLRFLGLFVCVCVFVWIFVCVRSDVFLGFQGLMVGVCVCLCGFLFVFVPMGFWVFKV